MLLTADLIIGRVPTRGIDTEGKKFSRKVQLDNVAGISASNPCSETRRSLAAVLGVHAGHGTLFELEFEHTKIKSPVRQERILMAPFRDTIQTKMFHFLTNSRQPMVSPHF